MIHDVDETLRALVRRDALPGTDVEVVFDAPTKDWSTRRNAPTIDLYLYDLREDLRRRQSQIVDVHENGRVTSRVQPPRWFKLSYLVTAWTQRPEDEHRLLSALLRCLLRSDRLPPDLLTGSLAGLTESVPYTCALPPPEDRALSDVWSALGGELKPSLDLVVYAPFDLTREIHIGPPVTDGARFDISGPGASERRVGQVPPDPAEAGADGDGAGGGAGGGGGGGGSGGDGSGGRGGSGGPRGPGGPGGFGGGARRGGARRGPGRGFGGRDGADDDAPPPPPPQRTILAGMRMRHPLTELGTQASTEHAGDDVDPPPGRKRGERQRNERGQGGHGR